MKQESYCAKQLILLEGEQILAVGEGVNRRLNPTNLSLKLPDVLSTKREGEKSYYRLREVKFKLQPMLVRKAVEQLRIGAEQLRAQNLDRLEIAVPLKNRKLKDNEKEFLGKALGGNRFQLKLDNAPVTLVVDGSVHFIGVILL